MVELTDLKISISINLYIKQINFDPLQTIKPDIYSVLKTLHIYPDQLASG